MNRISRRIYAKIWGGKVVKFMKKAVQIFGWAMLACYLLVLGYWMFIQNLTFWYD